MSRFTEAKLEQAIIELLGREDYPHVLGKNLWTPDHDRGDGRSKLLPLSVIPAKAGIQ